MVASVVRAKLSIIGSLLALLAKAAGVESNEIISGPVAERRQRLGREWISLIPE